jgi:heptosyltransferase-2
MRILLVKLSSLGDVLVSSSLPRAISELPKNITIDHVVMDHCSIITKFNPYISKQIIIPFLPSGKITKDFITCFGIIRQVYLGSYDKVFIFHRSPLLTLLIRLSGVRHVYGFKNKLDMILTNSVEYTTNKNRTTLEVELLHSGGLNIQHPKKLDFFLDPHFSDEAFKNLPAKFIACNPGGGNRHAPADNRMWSIDSYIQVIKKIDIPFVILGSGQQDLERAIKIENALPQKVINLVNKTNFSDSARIIKRSALYLGNDSSLSFLAASMEILTITLFGPTQAEAALPIGSKQFFLKSMSNCSPCYDPLLGIKSTMYTCNHNICMQSISPDSVINLIEKLISQPNE